MSERGRSRDMALTDEDLSLIGLAALDHICGTEIISALICLRDLRAEYHSEAVDLLARLVCPNCEGSGEHDCCMCLGSGRKLLP